MSHSLLLFLLKLLVVIEVIIVIIVVITTIICGYTYRSELKIICDGRQNWNWLRQGDVMRFADTL